MDRFPVGTRTQRRLERRQMLLMVVLVTAITAASFFLGVMFGERNSAQQVELAYQTAAQLAPPPVPNGAAGSQRLTFYDDLPKGNAAPLGSGINLPKGGYAPPPPPAPAAAAAPGSPAQVAAPVPSAAPAPAPAPVAKATPAAPPAKAPAAAPKASSGGKVVVQVFATKNQTEAKQQADRLRSKGYSVYTERADLGKKGVWYRVVAGPYADRAAADKAAAQLKKQNYSAIVRAR